jgi:hypothetical protein
MGLLSTFGFTSQVVMRREEFVAVDPSPYLGLTMYSQVGVLCEALGRSKVCYHNVPLVNQRTPPQSEKLAEAVGRLEESFMVGGPEKLAVYFGLSLGAFLQRIIERSVMTYQDVAGLPEQLFTKRSLWDWIEHNDVLARNRGIGFPPDVVRDYEALRVGVERARESSGHESG